MKFSPLYTLPLALCASLFLLANRNGRATVAGVGNTGAPGDQTVTCAGCHSGAALQSTTVISVLDSAGQAVSAYVPGRAYTVRVAVNPLTGTPAGYGFQLIGLRNAGNTDLDGFSDAGSGNNYKLRSIANGRTYAEHAGMSASPAFDVAWTAPASGTGAVTFYAAGNAVNNNNGTSGDGPSNSSLNLPEAQASSSTEAGAPGLAARVNPTVLHAGVTALTLTAPDAGAYRLAVYNLSGQALWETRAELATGANSVAVPAASWLPGACVLWLEKDGRRALVKLVKI